jgi:hypothetical protein
MAATYDSDQMQSIEELLDHCAFKLPGGGV